MEQMALLSTYSVSGSSIHGHSAETLLSKAKDNLWGATLLFPKGASPLTPCSTLSFPVLVLRCW